MAVLHTAGRELFRGQSFTLCPQQLLHTCYMCSARKCGALIALWIVKKKEEAQKSCSLIITHHLVLCELTHTNAFGMNLFFFSLECATQVPCESWKRDQVGIALFTLYWVNHVTPFPHQIAQFRQERNSGGHTNVFIGQKFFPALSSSSVTQAHNSKEKINWNRARFSCVFLTWRLHATNWCFSLSRCEREDTLYLVRYQAEERERWIVECARRR